MTRLLHTTAAFLAVAAAYLTYAATVVPLVEPQRREADVPADWNANLLNPESKYAELFAAIFPADHWTRRFPPKTFEDGQAMFVLQDYQIPGQDAGGQKANEIRTKPCVMIYFPTPWTRGKGPPPADCIILEAPQGGVIELDGPLNLLRDEFPQPTAARLMGPVVIKSDMDEPGPADDLEVTTQDVRINEQRIWTNAPVTMRLGPHYGSGRSLDIRFLTDTIGSRPDELRVDGIQSIQLLDNVRLVLQNDGKGSSAAFGLPDDRAGATLAGDSVGQVELTCKGPLFIDVPKQLAEFERDVEVFFIHQQGPSDRLACENLLVAFADRRASGVAQSAVAPPASPGVASAETESMRNGLRSRTALEPVRFVADGQPVTITSPSRQFHARCRRLVYKVPQRQLTLQSVVSDQSQQPDDAQMRPFADAASVSPAQFCDLQYGQHRLAAPQIEYTWDDKAPRGRLGTLRISGAGWLSGVDQRDESSQRWAARWRDGLQIVRQDDQPVLSLFGRPEMESVGFGRLAADEMYVWLREIATASGGVANREPHATGTDTNVNVVPDRMIATGGVEIDAPQLQGRVGQLEAWLVAPPAANANGSAQGGNATGPSPQRRVFDLSPNDAMGRVKSYYVEAERLQVRAVMTNHRDDEDSQRADVTHLTLTGDVLFEERPQPGMGTSPVRVEADWLEAADVHTASMFVNAKGQPVVVHADGKRLRGGAIHFDQAANRFDVPTAGDLSLTVDKDLEGQPLASPLPLTLSWHGALHFDGRQAVLTDQVHASTPEQRLQTQKLVATLGSSVPLGRLQMDGRVDFEKLECTGGVILDRRTFDAGGLASQEHAEIPNLTMERGSKQIFAAGPGWLRSVRLGRGDPLFRAAIGRSDAQLDNPGLSYLRVDFQRAMQGRHDTRDVAFEGQVRCVRGPVASWDQTIRVDGLTQLPDDTFLLNSSALRVGQRRSNDAQWHELEAKGSVEIEGGLGENGIFIGRGARLTYDQRKDLVILDGGAGMAELIHEESFGATRHTMTQKTVKFSPDPHRKYFQSDGFSQSSGGF